MNSRLSSCLCFLTAVNTARTAIADASALSAPLPSQQRALEASDTDLETCSLKESFFDITLINMGLTDVDPRYVEAFESAALRWSKVIVGGLRGFDAGMVDDWFAGVFSRPYNGAVEDLVIGYEIGFVDGPGNVLGSAGPVFVRRSPITNRPLSTISGVMLFDVDDFNRMATNDIKAIVLHEMGHVLGLIGTTGLCNAACDASNPNEQAVYDCPQANAEYSEWAPSELLVLENDGGMGTACGHWEEDAFRAGESSELMTGFFEANLFQPLSRVTVAALADIGGYEVDFCGADFWPATEETQQRFEVYKMNATMDVPNMMNPLIPIPDLPDPGQLMPVPTPGPAFPTDSAPFPTPAFPTPAFPSPASSAALVVGFSSMLLPILHLLVAGLL